MNGIPFESIAALFGITLPASVLAVLNVLQWVFLILFASSGYGIAIWQRRKRRKLEQAGHDLDWIVIGAGAVTMDMFHHIRTFAEKRVTAKFGELMSEVIGESAEATIRTPGTQVIHIENVAMRERIRARGYNLLNEYSKPEVVGFLSGKSGKCDFVAAFTCSDYADSRKVRLSVRSLEELKRYEKDSLLHRLVRFTKEFHHHDARLTREIAERWFANPTADNAYCFPVELYGR